MHPCILVLSCVNENVYFLVRWTTSMILQHTVWLFYSMHIVLPIVMYYAALVAVNLIIYKQHEYSMCTLHELRYNRGQSKNNVVTILQPHNNNNNLSKLTHSYIYMGVARYSGPYGRKKMLGPQQFFCQEFTH